MRERSILTIRRRERRFRIGVILFLLLCCAAYGVLAGWTFNSADIQHVDDAAIQQYQIHCHAPQHTGGCVGP